MSSKKKQQHPEDDWSDGQRSTLEALENLDLPPLPIIAFKKRGQQYAVAPLPDLINGRFALYERRGWGYPPELGALIAEFASARELVEAGWSFD